MIQTIFNIILRYLIGSFSGSMLLGKFQGIDIRKMGSGNAGGTNALRSVGPLFALRVIFIDILKGCIAVLYVYKLGFISEVILQSDYMQVLCGTAVVLGHVYPLYYNFKGGKGAGTLIGVVAILFPQCIPYALIVWIVTLVTTGFVGLGTMLASIALSISTYCLINELSYFYFSIFMSLFIIYSHRSNIKRMINGTENKFKKAMIFKK